MMTSSKLRIGSIERIASRVTAALLFLATLVAISACSAVEVPVWVIRADERMTVADGEVAVEDAIHSLGWRVDGYDAAARILATGWQRHSTILGTARTRVEARLEPTRPFAVAVTVPREVHDGRRWVLRGEDEARRAELVAALSARLVPAAAPPRD